MIITNIKKHFTPLFIIIGLGLLIRFLFWFLGSSVVWGDNLYIQGDTSGWADSFINLIKYGSYTFDLKDKEAYFGRVPGFSFFWGLHYLIFGLDFVYQSVAFTQIVLDTLAIYLVYEISISVFQNKIAARFTAFLYATYPFIIIWVTVSYSEILSNFLNIVCIYITLRINKGLWVYLLIGLLGAALFLTREFVGVIIAFSCLYIYQESKSLPFSIRVKRITLISLGFILGYSAWPIRNYVNHGRIIFARSSEGFVLYAQDYQAFRSWVVCWDGDENYWLNETLKSNYANIFPEQAFVDSNDKRLVAEALDLSKHCGTSFGHWEKVLKIENSSRQNTQDCNKEIALIYSKLRSNYISEKPFQFLIGVPFMNLKKAFFKSSNRGSEDSMINKLLFFYRSLLVLIGFLGIVFTWKNYRGLPLYGYILFIYCFFSFGIRYIEMRNLIQADTLLLIPAGWMFFILYQKGRHKLLTLLNKDGN